MHLRPAAALLALAVLTACRVTTDGDPVELQVREARTELVAD